MKINKLRAAREFSFQYLFHTLLPDTDESLSIYSSGENNDIALKQSLNEFKESTNSMFDPSTDQFILNMVKGTITNFDEIENIISKNLKNWKLERISKVDHANLLLAVYDLCFYGETPVSVVINEAVEISKKFGTKESASFINGVLDNIAKK